MEEKNFKITSISKSKQSDTISKLSSDTVDQVATQEHPANKSILSRHQQLSIVENFLIIWLDSNIDESNEVYKHSIIQLRSIVDSIKIFTDPNHCIDYLTKIENVKVFMIVSDILSQIIVPLIEDIPQLHSIYVFCNQQTSHTQCKKVKGVFDQIEFICDALTRDIHQSKIDLTSISIVPPTVSPNLDELDQSFMYSQLIKEIIFEIKYDEKAKEDCVLVFRTHYPGNHIYSNTIDQFERDYELHSPIWWYTKESFVYSLINKALRTQDTEIIIKMGFFIKDLHRQIEQLYSENDRTTKIIVYRGQGMVNVDFEKMMTSKGGLIFFNNFLSTSTAREVSFAFAESVRDNPDLIGILFKIEIDSSISSVPFASLNNISYYSDLEEEILFSMHSIFRIGETEQIEDRLWQINLVLTDDNDQQLKRLTDYIRDEIGGGNGWHRLGVLMNKMGKFEKALKIYNIILETRSNVNNKEMNAWLAIIYNNIATAHDAMGNYSIALSYYEKTLEIQLNILPPNHSKLATTYSNMAQVLNSMGSYTTALSYHEKALKIQQKSLSLDHPDLIPTYNNIGELHRSMGDYSVALSYYEKTLTIQQKFLPPNHPSLAITYNNTAVTLNFMGEYLAALSYYKKTLEINQKTLPSDHPELVGVHNNIGETHRSMGDFSSALLSYQKALDIQQLSLPLNQSNLATIFNNIGVVYHLMGDNSIALSHHEKALAIRKKSLPSNHPLLAITYNNIGIVHQSIEDYSTALVHYEKALEIQQKSHSFDHPELTATYNNICMAHKTMGNYTTALSYLEKTLAIQQKSLPSSHPSLATTYNNIATVHELMGDCSTALSYYEKSLDIRQKCLPPNHSQLASIYNNLGEVYRSTGNFSNALSYYEKASEIQQRSLKPDHPSLAITYNNIAATHDSMGNYSIALSYYAKTLEIELKSLSPNHLELTTTYNNIGEISLPPDDIQLATTYSNMGIARDSQEDYPTALTYYEKALEIQQKSLSPNHPSLVTIYALEHLGRFTDAVEHAERAVEIVSLTLGTDHIE
ncbi:unnamed protein product, partial [Didymodactylos carnosus]